jgi:plasmid maintenance system antidote protein VapI
MSVHNPAHPGELVKHDCLDALGLSVTEGAKVLGVTRQALSNLDNKTPVCHRKWPSDWRRPLEVQLRHG